MKRAANRYVKALGIVAIGVVVCGALIRLGDYDDAPGASLLGILLLIGSVVVGIRITRKKTID